MSISNEEYAVGWICAITTESVAARAFLDEEHKGPKHVAQHDDNNYTLGRIGEHNVVIAVLPDGDYGTASAAGVARDMLHSFPNIRIGLMVGIGGAAPTVKHDIRLGDIVVSTPRGGYGGVFQYDFGKTIQCQKFQATRFLDQPPTVLRTAVSGLKAQYEADGHQIQEAIQAALVKKPRLRRNYNQPDPITDRLYRADVVHPTEAGAACLISCDSDASVLVARRARDEVEDNPMIHYGLIASANQLMKDAVIRDKLAQEKDVLCFEMEAAGLMNHFPCLVIRGICDYSDTHKNKQWQGYAAMAAAAYAKDILNRIPPNKVEAEKKLSELHHEMHMDISTIRGQTSEIKTHVEELRVDGHLEKVRNWLAPPDPSTNFNKAREQYHEGTGHWLLNSEVYTKWKMEQNSFLWLYGIPGCGKTILSSSVVADLEQSAGSARTLLYFYFDFNDVDKQSLNKAVRSLITQLYFKRKDARKETDALYSSCNNGRRQPDQTSLLALLRNMLQRQHDSEVWIVLDALDECHARNEGAASGLMSYIKSLRDCTANVHLLVTSRPEHDLQSAIESWAHVSEIIPLQSTRVENDINSYIKAKTRQLGRWKGRPDIQNEIETVLSGKANGMFRWVACQFDVLYNCLDPKSVRTELANLPRTLDETYMRILQNVDPSQWDSAVRLLQFLTYSDRPLRLEEAVDAVAVDISNELRFDPNYRMPCPQEVVRYCSSLAVLVRRRDKRDGSEIVEIQLAHFSVQEYLISGRVKGHIASELSRSNASAALSAVCLSYLLSLDHSHQPKEARENYPLAQYSAKYWPKYAAIAEQSARMHLPLIREYFSSKSTMNFCNRIYNHDEPLERIGLRPKKSPNSLYYASLTGLIYSTQALIDDGADVNARDGYYGNALQAASAKGHKAIVRILVDQGADVNAQGGDYGNALQAASFKGNEAIVKILVDQGADVNARGGMYGNALQAASAEGDEAIVKILVDQGADVNAQGGYYGNALQAASATGDEATVRILVDQGANVNAQGGRYGNVLQAALTEGHVAIARILQDIISHHLLKSGSSK
ncbi:hypothetical protein BKA67DRAFT_534614 [Truncatella angustata]|uniref:NACHT domain-containing protein n=1 Tax=Truncatella angustata TaxID=152316 RepID=A0A9P8UPI9_9PEZI|nr:uncharacterized protein BKA67DRAFT_534614 [Truncatella angustata]KAH6655699.1 hypothetical protein BKA67DRAFT_534614 [Truncatella angustata]KAH8201907.1 hypothetical protein TruAng_003899 [Truncatella angustata]